MRERRSDDRSRCGRAAGKPEPSQAFQPDVPRSDTDMTQKMHLKMARKRRRIKAKAKRHLKPQKRAWRVKAKRL